MSTSTSQGEGPEPVLLNYEDLVAGKELGAEVAQAFGANGLGLCLVRGVPGLAEARRELLPLSRRLALQPQEVLERYEKPEAQFCVGWSRGREKFKGKPDLAKGSFYANPIFDDPANGNEEIRSKFAFGACRNVWPKEIPELEAAFKQMGRLVYEAAQPLVKQCDQLVEAQHPGHGSRLFDATFTNSRLVCGRLLHYFAGEDDESAWCGWHNDNSVITGLVPAIWLNEATGDSAPGSSSAGLFIKTRTGRVQRVTIPSDCLGFQIGEAAQIISGGVLVATPHQVRGHNSSGGLPLCRDTFALFMEPQWDAFIEPPRGVGYDEVLRNEEIDIIPPLSKRLKLGDQRSIMFGKLLEDSFAEYYAHNNAVE